MLHHAPNVLALKESGVLNQITIDSVGELYIPLDVPPRMVWSCCQRDVVSGEDHCPMCYDIVAKTTTIRGNGRAAGNTIKLHPTAEGYDYDGCGYVDNDTIAHFVNNTLSYSSRVIFADASADADFSRLRLYLENYPKNIIYKKSTQDKNYSARIVLQILRAINDATDISNWSHMSSLYKEVVLTIEQLPVNIQIRLLLRLSISSCLLAEVTDKRLEDMSDKMSNVF